MRTSSFHILRVGVAATFLWVGVLVLREPEAWGLYIQPWAADLLFVPMKEAMIGAAVLDISIGILLLANVLTWLAGLAGALHLAIIVVASGINAITVRDIGLFGAALAVAIQTLPDSLRPSSRSLPRLLVSRFASFLQNLH